MLKSNQMTEIVNAADVIDSESENETEFSVQIYSKKYQSTHIRMVIYCMICILVLVICGLIADTLWPRYVDGMDEKEAYYTLEYLMKNENFSKSDHELFETAFKTFDVNNDGYLNETEFSNYFEINFDFSKTFETIDVDKNDIISYPEAVVYVQKMNEIHSVKENSLKTMLEVVENKYGFEYLDTAVDETSLFGTFLEYVVIFEYFESFDTDFNGFIEHDEFLTVSEKEEFAAYDLDGSGQISQDNFLDILYGTDENSWKGQLYDMFGDNYQETMNEICAINITHDMVKNVEITLSPIKILRRNTNAYKRRLQSGGCWWVYDSACQCHRRRCYA